MINHNQIAPILLLIGTVGIPADNELIQYGFLGILLSILIWYSRNSYLENIKRETLNEKEKKEIIERYETKIEAESKRYHELHLEVMIFLKFKKEKDAN